MKNQIGCGKLHNTLINSLNFGLQNKNYGKTNNQQLSGV
jgi:hypothetical protein